MQSDSHTPIDIPFNFRHTCWFCGEPASKTLHFPRQANKKIEHALLAIPACKECDSIKYSRDISSIWRLRASIKQALITKYTRHLAIGENWTEEELSDSEFSGSILGGFGQSAWQMYEIAKQRIAYEGWPLSVGELPFDTFDDTSGFDFNGTRYASLSTCIDFFVSATDVDKDLLTQLVEIVTPERFEYALKIAKLNKRISYARRAQIIDDITEQEAEKREAALSQSAIDHAIEDVFVSGTIAPAFAIQWAMNKGVGTLSALCPLEDNYFDDFQHLGGAAAFASYNGLQLYLQAREDAGWIETSDPNKDCW
ncbi:hypothetical protein [Enterovibrio nigricans]|uniref:Uncharacterized protein n=1 Tax=Enterovibrio nigricans DSM 22720 TaxID=1121868 RepID=A0A1T4V9X1_9GAMM|nr:hypothetical protein [Enterovibrio nigricans]PKF50050.1 hypothetical protein AT251_14350 [Enterovibrio nigricans]SKA61702.1 hypothetical protein SAMN02745132_03512 [Enterovibrio nigricans DSM 22720]